MIFLSDLISYLYLDLGIIKSVGLSVRKILKTVTFEPALRLFIILTSAHMEYVIQDLNEQVGKAKVELAVQTAHYKLHKQRARRAKELKAMARLYAKEAMDICGGWFSDYNPLVFMGLALEEVQTQIDSVVIKYKQSAPAPAEEPVKIESPCSPSLSDQD